MATTTFVNGVTLSDEDWFNDLDRLHYDIFGDPADLAAVKDTLHSAPGAIGDVTPASGAFTTLTASGNSSVGGTFGVTGATTLSSTLATTGNATFSGDIIMDGTSKVMKALDGAVATPVYSFSSDPNTGVYRIGADNPAIAVGGNHAMSWDSSSYLHAGPGLTPTAGSHEIWGAVTTASGKFLVDFTNSHGSDPIGPRVHHTTTTNDASHFFFKFTDSSATRAEIRTNGGLANFSANNVNLSDERLKNITGRLESQRGKFKQLEIAKGGYKDSDDQNIAFLTAQNVQQVYPECVTFFDEKNGVLGVREHGVWMRHMAVTQEHDTLIDQLLDRIAVLENKLANAPIPPRP
jgi:hypothetical protein